MIAPNGKVTTATETLDNIPTITPAYRGKPLSNKMGSLTNTALRLAEQGLFVHPLKPNAKTPLTSKGYKDSTRNPEQICKWWLQWPNANIGIAAGLSGLVILDIDMKNGIDGEASLTKLLNAQHTLPPTLEVRTSTGGRHLYFAMPSGVVIKNSAGKLGPGLDIRGDGGYVVAAGSVIGGKEYEITSSERTIIAVLPNWLVTATAKEKASTTQTLYKEVAKIGERNDALFRIASRLRADNVNEKEARGIVLEAATRCQPPLAEAEALRCLESAWRYPPNLHLTDAGNAQRLTICHGLNMRYLHAIRKWLLWDNRWIFDDNGGITRLAKDAVLGIYTEAAMATGDTRRRKTSQWAITSESLPRLSAMVELAKSEPGIPLRSEELDCNEMLLGMLNGTLNLYSGLLREPQRRDYISKSAYVNYDSAATCPIWLEFLDTIMNRDSEMVAFLQRAAGYCLTGNTSEQCLFLLYGTGANGKSTFVNVLRDMLGDYGANTPAETLMVQKSTGARNDVARLRGVRLATAIETEDGQRLAESLLKSLTGGDTISARFLYGEFFDFLPQFKIFLAANHKPIIKGDDYAIWRRVRMIPFEVTIPLEDQDKSLAKKLHAELPGIFNWAIEGCIKWQQHGLHPPDKILMATDAYREEMDFLHQFLEECCRLDSSATVGATELYKAYEEWAKCNTGWYISQTKFGRKLVERGFAKEKTPRIRYRGIRLEEDF